VATFLVTRKMPPALAARVEESVRGRRAAPRRFTALLRAAIVLLVLAVVVSFFRFRRREVQKVEGERAALLSAVRVQSGSLTPDDRASFTKVEALVQRFAGPYEGDVAAPELRLADVVARPAVYVRGPSAALATPQALAQQAALSAKDAFLLCLVEPPASRAEKVVLAKTRIAYSGRGLVEQKTPNVRRLYEEEAGMRVLAPAWEDQVRAAKDERDVASLRAELERAPIEHAKDAARAALLIVVADEPADGTGAADLDGERAHSVRVGLVELPTSKVLLRTRKRVDPSAWSNAARAEYSSGLDGCALAYDLHHP
jgi:hypothetical protein